MRGLLIDELGEAIEQELRRIAAVHATFYRIYEDGLVTPDELLEALAATKELALSERQMVELLGQCQAIGVGMQRIGQYLRLYFWEVPEDRRGQERIEDLDNYLQQNALTRDKLARAA